MQLKDTEELSYGVSFSFQVRVLFSKGPFISIFASDPHIIIKAINQNLNSVLRDSNINGHDYMRNIVHLPVFLNSRGFNTAKKMSMAAPTNGEPLSGEGKRQRLHVFLLKCFYFFLYCRLLVCYIAFCV